MNTFLYPIGAAKIRKKKENKKENKKRFREKRKNMEKLFFIIGLLLPARNRTRDFKAILQHQKKLINSIRFSNVTIPPKKYKIHFVEVQFLYLPITFSEEVRYTCKKIVIGNWILSII